MEDTSKPSEEAEMPTMEEQPTEKKEEAEMTNEEGENK